MERIIDKTFDPLELTASEMEEATLCAKKRMIKNVLDCYAGWYDPFCEMIQNALDAVDKLRGLAGYEPRVKIIIDIANNSITVVDNGVGFKSNEFKTFLAPNYSFKDGDKNLRGRKGVGATYLAYGFNYLRVATKNEAFTAKYVMKNGKNWADGDDLKKRPHMEEDDTPICDPFFANESHGTLMTVKCDSHSRPANLSWPGINDAKGWAKILRVRTALGEITTKSQAKITIKCIDKEGEVTSEELSNTTYLMIDELVHKSANIDEILAWREKQFNNSQDLTALPSKYKNLDGVFGTWDARSIIDKVKSLSDSERDLIIRYNITAMFGYVYSLSIWDAIDEGCGIRKGAHVLYGGIQMAVNNMPQGELIQIPLTKNIGRQKQVNILLHFENCDVDMGRKVFDKGIVDLAKDLSRKMMDGPFKAIRTSLRPNSGAPVGGVIEKIKLSQWKKDMELHEKNSPLVLDNPCFFKPVNQIAVLSTPTREQDVIALFNQLLAGGVIRGIRIMSTNERTTYDGLFRVFIKNDETHKFDSETNPLGITDDVADRIPNDMKECVSDPQILEYKYSLNGLIEDIEDGSKNLCDIDLVVAWEAGDQYKENYLIRSYLVDGEEGLREYHGVTHDLQTFEGSHVCDMILLKDLIMKLKKDPKFDELQDSYEQY